MRNIETNRASLRLTFAATAGLILVSSAPAGLAQQGFVLADARAYRHCHNLPKKTYCHKNGQLPIVSPPFSDRSRRHDLRKETPCHGDPARCANTHDHQPG
jgi:hypothetical protein